jgi:two-component system KDP operon response regulator KdpE
MAKILLVEDDRTALKFYEAALGGHEVLKAETAKNALAIISAASLDLVILDFNLPDAPGSSVCQQIARQPENATIPIILLMNSSGDARHIPENVTQVLWKPITAAVFQRTVQAVLTSPARS